MKKRIIILLIILIFLTSGCNNKEKIEETTTTKVNTTISDITNITPDHIKESYIYIKDNYQNYKKDDIYENLLYHIKYLEELGKYSKENELTILADNVSNYLKKSNKENKQKIIKIIEEIEEDEENIIKEIYNNYLKLKTIKEIVEKQTLIVEGDLNDKNLKTVSNINKAIDYLSKHGQNPFKNDEILEKSIYYSMFLSNQGKKENNITKLGQKMYNYITTLDEKEKDEFTTILNSINKNQQSQVKLYCNEINTQWKIAYLSERK